MPAAPAAHPHGAGPGLRYRKPDLRSWPERGYEMIGVDQSEEMLAQAAEKCRARPS
ncbi:MAG: hypothetical protein ACLU9S_09905 [Oscillospiraceae bacterium]